MIRALAAGLGLAVVAAPLGCFVVWNRMAYFGETIAQAGLIGIALGMLLKLDLTLAVLAVAILTAGLLILLGRQKLLPLEFDPGHRRACGAGARRRRDRAGQGAERRSRRLPVRRHPVRHRRRPVVGLCRRQRGACHPVVDLAAAAGARGARGARRRRGRARATAPGRSSSSCWRSRSRSP